MRFFLRCVIILLMISAPVALALKVFPEESESEPFALDESIRCAIELGNYENTVRGYVSGYNFTLLNMFASDYDSQAEILISRGEEQYLDSLAAGVVDIVVVPGKVISKADYEIAYSKPIDNMTLWAVQEDRKGLQDALWKWLEDYHDSEKHDTLHKAYFDAFNDPLKAAELGRRMDHLGPYDGIIRQYADSLGWDWRLLAAVIYQESKFHIEAQSKKGASGLMQLLPSTARHHEHEGDDLLDPEQNIKTGVRYLNRLQRMFTKRADGPENARKFALASYNAGEGHIIDAINFADWLGMKNDTWEDLSAIFPTMADDFILKIDTVKLGKFHAEQTLDYITGIYDLYDAFCTICPE